MNQRLQRSQDVRGREALSKLGPVVIKCYVMLEGEAGCYGICRRWRIQKPIFHLHIDRFSMSSKPLKRPLLLNDKPGCAAF